VCTDEKYAIAAGILDRNVADTGVRLCAVPVVELLPGVSASALTISSPEKTFLKYVRAL
jgi:hypothetical protein